MATQLLPNLGCQDTEGHQGCDPGTGLGEEKALLKAQQQIPVRTPTPTQEPKKSNQGRTGVDPVFVLLITDRETRDL